MLDRLLQRDLILAAVVDRDLHHRIADAILDDQGLRADAGHVGEERAAAGMQCDGVELRLVDAEGQRAGVAVPVDRDGAVIDRLADARAADEVAAALCHGEMRIGAADEAIFVHHRDGVAERRLHGVDDVDRESGLRRVAVLVLHQIGEGIGVGRRDGACLGEGPLAVGAHGEGAAGHVQCARCREAGVRAELDADDAVLAVGAAEIVGQHIATHGAVESDHRGGAVVDGDGAVIIDRDGEGGRSAFALGILGRDGEGQDLVVLGVRGRVVERLHQGEVVAARAARVKRGKEYDGRCSGRRRNNGARVADHFARTQDGDVDRRAAGRGKAGEARLARVERHRARYIRAVVDVEGLVGDRDRLASEIARGIAVADIATGEAFLVHRGIDRGHREGRLGIGQQDREGRRGRVAILVRDRISEGLGLVGTRHHIDGRGVEQIAARHRHRTAEAALGDGDRVDCRRTIRAVAVIREQAGDRADVEASNIVVDRGQLVVGRGPGAVILEADGKRIGTGRVAEIAVVIGHALHDEDAGRETGEVVMGGTRAAILRVFEAQQLGHRDLAGERIDGDAEGHGTRAADLALVFGVADLDQQDLVGRCRLAAEPQAGRGIVGGLQFVADGAGAVMAVLHRVEERLHRGGRDGAGTGTVITAAGIVGFIKDNADGTDIRRAVAGAVILEDELIADLERLAVEILVAIADRERDGDEVGQAHGRRLVGISGRVLDRRMLVEGQHAIVVDRDGEDGGILHADLADDGVGVDLEQFDRLAGRYVDEVGFGDDVRFHRQAEHLGRCQVVGRDQQRAIGTELDVEQRVDVDAGILGEVGFVHGERRQRCHQGECRAVILEHQLVADIGGGAGGIAVTVRDRRRERHRIGDERDGIVRIGVIGVADGTVLIERHHAGAVDRDGEGDRAGRQAVDVGGEVEATLDLALVVHHQQDLVALKDVEQIGRQAGDENIERIGDRGRKPVGTRHRLEQAGEVRRCVKGEIAFVDGERRDSTLQRHAGHVVLNVDDDAGLAGIADTVLQLDGEGFLDVVGIARGRVGVRQIARMVERVLDEGIGVVAAGIDREQAEAGRHIALRDDIDAERQGEAAAH
nr:H405 [uncultured bacterium]